MTTPKATCSCGAEKPAIGSCPKCGKGGRVAKVPDWRSRERQRMMRELTALCEDRDKLRERAADLNSLRARAEQERDDFERLYHSNVRCQCGDDDACRFARERDAALALLLELRPSHSDACCTVSAAKEIVVTRESCRCSARDKRVHDLLGDWEEDK